MTRGVDPVLNSPFFKTAQGRLGNMVYRTEDGKTTVEHCSKAKRTTPNTPKQAAARAMARRIADAYAALDAESFAAWTAYARSLAMRKKIGGVSRLVIPSTAQVFRSAMLARWKAEPNAPVILDPFQPVAPEWHGDGI